MIHMTCIRDDYCWGLRSSNHKCQPFVIDLYYFTYQWRIIMRRDLYKLTLHIIQTFATRLTLWLLAHKRRIKQISNNMSTGQPIIRRVLKPCLQQKKNIFLLVWQIFVKLLNGICTNVYRTKTLSSIVIIIPWLSGNCHRQLPKNIHTIDSDIIYFCALLYYDVYGWRSIEMLFI